MSQSDTPTQNTEKGEEDKIHPAYPRFRAFMDEFKNETDRACVILCGAKIDFLLQQILARYLLPNTGSSDELLDSDKPLGTFSSKIHACYRLGIIDSEFARALNIFRKMRNIFAHEMSNCSFASGSHRDRINELSAPLRKFEMYEKFKKSEFDGKDSISAEYMTTMAVVVGRLEGLLSDIEPIKATTLYSFIPPKWTKDQSSQTKR
jgi:DNA-binding MltR family transcriptional regulator